MPEILRLWSDHPILPGVGVERDLTEKIRDLQSLMPVFLRFGDFQQMRNRRIA